MNRIHAHLRNRFLAGVLVVVPLVATFLALRFLFRQIDGVFSPWVTHLVGRDIPGLGIVATLLIVVVVGSLATNLVGGRMIRWGERVIARVPFVRTIYKATKDILQATTVSGRQIYQNVVLVEYPRRGSYSYGFVTSYIVLDGHGEDGRCANVFIPSPPVPTTGALIVVPVTDLIPLDLTSEEVLKLILSGGVSAPPQLHRRGDLPAVGGTSVPDL